MKQFLRYQISGSVFIIWAAIFYYSSVSVDLVALLNNIFNNHNDWRAISAAAIALPIGVLIHQLSVVIKNCIIAPFAISFSDFPVSDEVNSLIKCPEKPSDWEKNKYILERISNLNSFYYVRFDNGFLAPLLAYLIVSQFINHEVSSYAMITAAVITAITLTYILRIHEEIKVYKAMLAESKPSPQSKRCCYITLILILSTAILLVFT